MKRGQEAGLSRHHARRWSLILAIVAVLLLGGASYAYWRQNQAPPTVQGTVPAAATDERAPSTTRPTTKQVAQYTVPADAPRYLRIERLGVQARVVALGVIDDNQLQAPANVFDAGWYQASAKPGTDGAMLLDGHVSSWKTHGVFYGLKDLRAGDKLTIERGDGKTFTYEVVRSQSYDADKTDMAAAQKPVDPSRPGLNLITCDGQVIKGTNHFDKRLIVFTRQV